ncbi:competence protein ComK [Bacillus sp. EB01]|uniref:competence protein ComK n=1 Tax=Bacillus sp. EB01 TaxID=1347086 RepID=UPI0005C5268D|nr:competence protein ComK [Bacillus sp. EB01]
MDILSQYIINENTAGFWEEYDEFGNRLTEVFEGEKKLTVDKSPLKIIDFTLMNQGFSLQGAKDGSKHLLGKGKNVHPLTINAQHGIFLIPTKAYGRHDCLWLSLMHVQDMEAINSYTTRVFLSFGHTVVLDMKEYVFIKKLHKARRLRKAVAKSNKSPITFYVQPETGYKIAEEDGGYRVK